MTKWISRLDWLHVVEIAGAVTIGVSAAVYAVGVDRTNMGRDVRQNTVEISRNSNEIEKVGRLAEANRTEVQNQRSALARIEEGVEWIKRDLEKK